MIKGSVWFKSGQIDIEILDPILNIQEYDVDELTDLIFSKVNKNLNS